MRITFDNPAQANTDKVTTAYSAAPARQTEKAGGIASDISGTVMDNNAYGVQGRTAEEVMQDAQLTDVSVQRNYMAVMSNSMSAEDFSKMLEEGVNPNDMDVETVVTIVDRIKAELMKSGVQITGYTDNLDIETLSELVGSRPLASHIADAFAKNDIPLTRENVEQTLSALGEAEKLGELTEGEMKYLVSNQMEPTIENLYTAQFSGAGDADRQGRGYYQEAYGYYAKKAESGDLDKLRPQMEQIIRDAGLEVTKETLEQSRWLVEKGIPLTGENLLCMRANAEAVLPPKEEQVIDCIAGAMAEGKPAIRADLHDGRSKYEKAADLSARMDTLLQEEGMSLTARRQLEEARLRMTAEVNVRLIESGFSLDTSRMEGLIEALKEAESRQAETMFPAESRQEAVQKYELYRDSITKAERLPFLPAAALGKVLFGELALNTDNLYEEGTALQKEYEKANQSYEALMTTPRRDMGDTIGKAFANIDVILTDMGLEIKEANRRAVRILSYNQTAITRENLLAVKKADHTVQRVVEKMTPAATLKMIRDGINPLTLEMEELEQYFSGRQETVTEEMETYSRYLYRLESNHDITPQEREAYIGVYRLLKQIEKTDGAVVGSVLKEGSRLNFRQLLRAVRTAQKAGMNLVIDDDFGGLTDLVEQGEAIDDQIDQIENIRYLKNAETEVIKMLQDYDIPVTVNHMLAAESLIKEGGLLFRYLKEQTPKGTRSDSGKATKEEKESRSDLDQLSEGLIDALSEQETMNEAYEEFTGQMMDMLKENLYQPGQTSVDVKAMKSACVQLSLASAMAKQETYEIPVYLNQELIAMRLTIVHESSETGKAVISAETGQYGKITASLKVTADRVSGYVTAEESFVEELDGFSEKFEAKLQEQGLKLHNFHILPGEEKEGVWPEKEAGEETVSTQTIYETAKSFIQILQASL